MDYNERLQAIENKLNTIITLLQRTPAASTITTEETPFLYSYCETWLNEVKAPKIKPKSLSILRNAVERYIKPVIADKPLNEVKTSEMLEAIEKCPYSYMRQVVYNVFRAVFKRAYQYDIIAENPAAKLDFVYHKRKKGRALAHEEQARFIAVLEDEPRRALWLFYLLSGCRCQEAVTLQWQDVDEYNARIFIRGTKTETSERFIPLFPQLSDILKDILHEGERVFPFTNRQVRISFDHIRQKCGFHFRIHDLRHTFATRCLECGISTKTVSKWLGHKHTSTTEEIYSHLLTDFERQEVAKFNLQI